MFRVRTSCACTCKRVTEFKDKQCDCAYTWCKWIGFVETTCTWRPLLETCEIKQVNKPTTALGTREAHGDWEMKNKRETIKWYRDVKWSWRVSCTVCRVQPLSDIFNKEFWAAVDISVLQDVNVLACPALDCCWVSSRPGFTRCFTWCLNKDTHKWPELGC